MLPQQQKQQEGTDIVIQGRMVWGGVKAQPELIYGTRQPKLNDKGQPIINYKFGLAVPKISPQSSQAEINNFNTLWNAIHVEASKMGVQYPNNNFAWKFTDGDGRKEDGSEYPAHSKGCLVLACKTNFPLNLSAWEGEQIVQISEDQIKCGDFVQVAINIRAHAAPNAGLYVNPSFVCRFAYGEPITNAPSPMAVFQAPPAFMPAGASQTPIGGMPMMGQQVNPFAQPAMPDYSQQQAPQFQAPQQFQQPMQPQAPQFQAPPIQPHTSVLPTQFQQQAPQMGNALPQQAPQAYGNTNPFMQQQQIPNGPATQAPPFNQMGNASQFAAPVNPGMQQPQMNQQFAGPATTPAFPFNGQQQQAQQPQVPGFPQFPGGR